MTHWWLAFWLSMCGASYADTRDDSSHGCQRIVVATTQPSGDEIPLPCVEWLALREGLCRSMWVQGERITEVTDIPCPTDELRRYLR